MMRNNKYSHTKKYCRYSSFLLSLAAACGLSACSTAKPAVKELTETELATEELTEYLTETETETEPQTEADPIDFARLEESLNFWKLQYGEGFSFAQSLLQNRFPKIEHTSPITIPENFAYDLPVIPGDFKFSTELQQFPLPVLPLRITVLEKEIASLLETYDGTWSVYVKNLTTGDSFLLGDQPMKSASIMKLFIMGTVYDAIHNGELERTSEVTGLLNDMISYSSNEDSNRLLELLGDGSCEKGIEKVNLYITEHHYDGETHEYNGFNNENMIFDEDHFNQVSAKDCGKLLERIYHRTFGSRQDCNEIESMMLNQHTRYKIPAGLPNGTAVGSKSGEMDFVENDVAIIYGDKSDYILCVLSSDWKDKKEAISHIADISSMVYEFFDEDAYYLETPDLTAYDYEPVNPDAETSIDDPSSIESQTETAEPQTEALSESETDLTEETDTEALTETEFDFSTGFEVFLKNAAETPSETETEISSENGTEAFSETEAETPSETETEMSSEAKTEVSSETEAETLLPNETDLPETETERGITS